jgi:hypothetical protein
MTVAELIERLQEMNPDSPVQVSAPVVGHVDVTDENLQDWTTSVVIFV